MRGWRAGRDRPSCPSRRRASLLAWTKQGGLSMNRWRCGAVATMALVAAVGTPVAAQSRSDQGLSRSGFPGTVAQRAPGGFGKANTRATAAAGGCGAVRLGQTTVAAPGNTLIVTLLANETPLTLLLDTGAEATILTPAAAQRVGAQSPRVEFQRPMTGV